MLGYNYMKIHRFIGPFDLSKKEIDITDKEIFNQMKNVLRLKIGEIVELCDGLNISAIAEILKIEKDNIHVSAKEVIKDKNKTKNDVTLFCAILKKENFELVVQKTTECGVSKIVPIITSRTIKNGLNMERLRKIAKEASEQCGRTNIPEILEPMSFDESLKLFDKNDFNILFDSSGEQSFEIRAYSPAGELLCSDRRPAQCISNECSPSQINKSKEFSNEMPCERDGANTRNFSAEKYPCISEDNSLRINLFIGPEGGWTDEEIIEAKKINMKTASLGSLVLRGETAAIIATYLISNLE